MSIEPMVEQEDNIVKEYKSGNTTIRVHDQYYRNKTKKEIDDIISNMEKFLVTCLKESAE